MSFSSWFLTYQDTPMPPLENNSQGDAPVNHTQAAENSAALHSDLGLGNVGDSSANHAWSQMTGASMGGADRSDLNSEKGGHPSGGAHGGAIDFGAHSDIYHSSGGGDGSGGGSGGGGGKGGNRDYSDTGSGGSDVSSLGDSSASAEKGGDSQSRPSSMDGSNFGHSDGAPNDHGQQAALDHGLSSSTMTALYGESSLGGGKSGGDSMTSDAGYNAASGSANSDGSYNAASSSANSDGSYNAPANSVNSDGGYSQSMGSANSDGSYNAPSNSLNSDGGYNQSMGSANSDGSYDGRAVTMEHDGSIPVGRAVTMEHDGSIPVSQPVTMEHNANTSGGEVTQFNSDASDGGSDKPLAQGEMNRPPELSLPSPDMLANGPIDQLQSMSRDSRQALDNYVQDNSGNIPSLALHGTNESSAKSLTNYTQQGEIWVAGPHPDRKDMGANQYVGDLSVSAQTSMSYAQKRGEQNGHEPGPVLVYDASNQPEAWSKTNYSNGGSVTDGQNSNDTAKFGLLDLKKAQLIGSVSREDINSTKSQFEPLNNALMAKQSDILNSPGGLNEGRVNDLLARVQVMNELNRVHETRMVLDAVARSKMMN